MVDAKNKAYWLGVMYSDGFISTTNEYTKYFGLTVQESDKDWLEQFKHYLEYNGRVKSYEQTSGYAVGTKYSRLQIGNNKIVEDLTKWGVVENKTKIISHIPETQYKKEFIRGYIDGDGSINKRSGSIMIAGNYDMLSDIGDNLNVEYRIYEDKSIFSLYIKALDSREILKDLYSEAQYYLPRKYNLAQKYFS